MIFAAHDYFGPYSKVLELRNTRTKQNIDKVVNRPRLRLQRCSKPKVHVLFSRDKAIRKAIFMDGHPYWKLKIIIWKYL